MKTRNLFVCPVLALSLMAVSFPSTTTAAEQLGENWKRRYDQNTYLTTHNSYANVDANYRKLIANQTVGIKGQLDAGARCLSLDIFLVREKEKDALMHFEMYTNRNQYLTPTEGFTNILPAIVLAHEPRKWDYQLFTDYPWLLRSFENIFTALTDIKEWLDDNPNEVVTIVFESYVAEPEILWWYFGEAELDDMIFLADRPNPDFPGPDGTSWNVPVHGWPRLYQMVLAGKRLVVFSGNGVEWTRYSGQPIDGASSTNDDGMPNWWNFAVENEYGSDGIGDDGNDGTADQSRNGNALDNMAFALTWMNWFPDANTVGPDWSEGSDPDNHIWDFGDLNRYELISQTRDRFANAAKRYPNFISVDFYHKGDDGGPRRLVRECNTYWGNRPVVSASITVTPAPNMFGWRKSATVTASGNVPDGSMSIRSIHYYWHGGHDILGHSEETGLSSLFPKTIRLTNGSTNDNPSLGTTSDGIFRVSAEALTGFGDRSDRAVTWVRIDSTPPLVNPVVSRPPDSVDGWHNHPVTIQVNVLDLLSGARHVWWSDALGQRIYSGMYSTNATNQFIERRFDFPYEQEGHVFVRFIAEDFAGNTNATNSGFILMKLDMTPPSTIVSALSSNAGTRTAALQAYDALSGTNGTWYQLDGATNWTPYTVPIAMSASQPHTLQFFSRDVAGNEEEVKTYHVGQTAITLIPSRNPAGYFQAMYLTATVTGPGPRPTGTVTFFDGTNVMGTATLDTNGNASIELSPVTYRLSLGSHQLTARFDGNSNYSAATSTVLTQQVVNPPGLAFNVSPTHPVQTQPVVLSADVFSEDGRIPGGTVTFTVRNGVSGNLRFRSTVPLDTNGHASVVVDDLPYEYLLVFADYNGDEDFPPNDSPGAKEILMQLAETIVAIATTPNPSHLGEPVTFQISVSSTPGATPPVNGSVRIVESDEPIEVLPLEGRNTVTYVTSGLATGTHSFLVHANVTPRLSGGATIHEHVVLPQEVPAPVFRDIRKNTNGTMDLRLDVMSGRGVQFEYSTQLPVWTNLVIGTNTGMVLQITDYDATNSAVRFYRARLLD